MTQSLTHKGLSAKEAEQLQLKYGFNEIKEKTQSITVRFFKKFIEPIPIMIEAALVLSAIGRRWEDFSVIFILLGINIMVDFFQEKKAYKALQALKETLSPTAVVLRDGKFGEINARELVPNDVIKITIGDIVPADIIMLDDTFLYVDQSTITGESLPVEKNKGDIVYASSIIQKGLSIACVTATGGSTSIGKNAHLVAKAELEKESHFQKAIFTIGKFLIVLSTILIIIVGIVSTIGGGSLVETIRFSIVLAVASIPVALPAVLSVTMAIGANELIKKRAIVSNFKSIEELAGIDVLCIDKTGTLTKNKIEVSSPKIYSAFDLSDLFTYALLAIEPSHKSSIEKAVYSYAQKNNLTKEATSYSIDTFIPFDPSSKITEVSAHSDTDTIKIIMGAPQMIMEHIGVGVGSEKISYDVETFAEKGFRTIAVAKKIDDTYVPVGIIPLFDPLREDSASVISAINERNVDVKMLTGDHVAIAKYIANFLTIGKQVVDRSALSRLRKTKTIRDDIDTIASANIFAEVVPEDKYFIIDTLQKDGHTVAMTGDGVNDAPALKKADIGIAVSGASPAAQSAADIVLLGDGLSIIKSAIDLARMIFSRMRSYATFRISETIRIVLFITLSILIFNYSPLSAIMIILLALLNDIPVMAIAYDNAPIHKKFIRWHLREVLFISIILGVTGLVSSFALFYWLNTIGFSIAIIQTILFIKLDVAGHSTLYLTRTGQKHFWERPFPSLKFFLPAFSSRIIGTLLAFFGIFMEPVSWQIILYIWIYATIWFLVTDQIKVLSYKVFNKFKKPIFKKYSTLAKV